MTIDELSGLFSNGYGVIVWGGWAIAVSLVLLVARSLVKGNWIPRRTLDLLLAEKDQQISYHKAASESRRQALNVKDAQIDELIGGLQTTRKLLETAERAAARNVL